MTDEIVPSEPQYPWERLPDGESVEHYSFFRFYLDTYPRSLNRAYAAYQRSRDRNPYANHTVLWDRLYAQNHWKERAEAYDLYYIEQKAALIEHGRTKLFSLIDTVIDGLTELAVNPTQKGWRAKLAIYEAILNRVGISPVLHVEQNITAKTIDFTAEDFAQAYQRAQEWRQQQMNQGEVIDANSKD